jgi:hypothetical protein
LATVELNEAQKNVREYLAVIGKHGGLASRRADALARKTDGRNSGSQTSGAESGKNMASSRPQPSQTFVN